MSSFQSEEDEKLRNHGLVLPVFQPGSAAQPPTVLLMLNLCVLKITIVQIVKQSTFNRILFYLGEKP